ncbi:hypothetical protein D3C76_1553480 [compost metagenome]
MNKVSIAGIVLNIHNNPEPELQHKNAPPHPKGVERARKHRYGCLKCSLSPIFSKQPLLSSASRRTAVHFLHLMHIIEHAGQQILAIVAKMLAVNGQAAFVDRLVGDSDAEG